MDFSRTTVLLGAPRSGTSWIGKIYDSHPHVLYRHEPDLALWEPALPFLILPDQVDGYVSLTARYAERLARTPTLKSSGQLPLFHKAYQPRGAAPVRSALIHGLRWVERLAWKPGVRAARIPDLCRPRDLPSLHIVMKTISARGRACALVKAMPEAYFVFIMRHPCGQIASALRGQRQGKFETGTFVKEILNIPLTRQYGLTEANLESASPAAKLAWHWTIMNQFALDALAGRPKTRVVIYENVCADPLHQARDMLAFSDIEWHGQTEAFICDSTSHSGVERYYGVFRNAVASASKWRTELSKQDQATIWQIVRQTPLAHYWPETSPLVPDPQLAPAYQTD